MGNQTSVIQKILSIPNRPETLIEIAFILVMLIALYLISTINYVLFHSIVEVAGIAVVSSIFIIVWNTRRKISDGFFLIIGISFIFFGSIDLLHTLAYKGMNIIAVSSSDLPTQLWIAARYFQSITFFIATLFIGRSITRDRKYDVSIIIAACTTASTLLYASIFTWHTFPSCYIEGIGLTSFKIVSEFIISFILILTILILYLKREHFDPIIWKLLISAQTFLILGELAFTSYVSVYGFMNLLGHLFRFISVYLFYRVFVVISLTRPYDLIFHELKEKENALQESIEEFRAVFDQTYHLMGVLDSQGILREINAVAVKYLRDENLDPVSVLGKPFWCTPWWVHDPVQQDQLKQAIKRVASGEVVRFEATHPSGNDVVNIDFSLKPVKDKNDTVFLLIAEGWDITERKLAEKSLQELDFVIRHSPAIVFVWRAEKGWPVHYVSDNIEQFGYTAEDFLSGNVIYTNIIHPDDLTRVVAEVARYSSEEGREEFNQEYRILKADQTFCWIDDRTWIRRDDTGLITHYQGIIFDINERKQAEEAVKAAVQLNQLIDAMSISECMSFTLDEAERLTNSMIGFFHLLNPDEQTIQLIAWSTKTRKHCFIPKEPDRHYPVEKAGVWVDCLRERKPIIHNDYANLPHKRGLPEGHVQVLRELVVPIFDEDRIVAIIGVGNKGTDYQEKDITVLTLLAKNVWTLIQRKHVEEALKESEERFRTMSENSLTGVYIFVDGVVKYANPTFARILGYTPEELIGMDPLDTVHPDDRDMVRDRMVARFDNKEIISVYECRLITKDNRTILVSIMGTLIPYQGRLAISGNLMDITERKLVEEALRESEFRFRELFNSMSSGVGVYQAVDDGTNFVIVDFNPAAEVIEKVSKQDVIGKHVSKVFPGVFEFGIMEVFMRVWHTGIPEHHPLSLYHDNRISSWRENYIYRLPSGEIVAIYDDVTARKRVEEALIESEQKFRDIFNNTSDAIHIHGIRDDWTPGRFTEINDVTCKILGYTKDELLAMSPFDITTDYHSPSLEKILETQQITGTARFETEYRKKDGSIVPVEVNTHVVTIQGTRVMLGVVRDITERKFAEEALRQANKKLNLLSSITRHDINNQIQVLIFLLDFAKEAIHDTTKQLEIIQREEGIVDNIYHQISFTKDYEDLGIMAPAWQNVDSIIQRCISQLHPETVQIISEEPNLEIFADPLLQKVFYNLFDNALRYGGEKMTTIRVLSHEENDFRIIVVEDDGEGISMEDKEKLFSKGFGKHTGLGLFLSREILSITGITITENGVPGIGAQFDIHVPKGEFRFSNNT
jgi:PAS domain S-box-containing protein